MTFNQSIGTCFCKYIDFDGRASRSELWWFYLFNVLSVAGMSVIDCWLLDQCWISGGDFSLLWNMAILLPTLAVAARRLHDIGKSGWWQLLIWIVPIIGFIVIISMWCRRSDPKVNKYGGYQTASNR